MSVAIRQCFSMWWHGGSSILIGSNCKHTRAWDNVGFCLLYDFVCLLTHEGGGGARARTPPTEETHGEHGNTLTKNMRSVNTINRSRSSYYQVGIY